MNTCNLNDDGCGVRDLPIVHVDEILSVCWIGQHAPARQHETGAVSDAKKVHHRLCQHVIEELQIYMSKYGYRKN